MTVDEDYNDKQARRLAWFAVFAISPFFITATILGNAYFWIVFSRWWAQ